MPTFQASASATVNGAGVATVTLGPGAARETWEVIKVSVMMTPSTSVGVASIYQGLVAAPSAFIEGTYDGPRDASPQQPGELVLEPGEAITVQWTAATVGATCTAVLRYRRV